MYALIDCNNFFASCERLFRPDLRNKPLIVLSNNDGAIISRSNEAKALGIKMGEPYFKVKGFCKQHHVHVFSSNYTLYRDLSQRIMSILEEAWDNVEIYSVDEAFLDLSMMPFHLHESFCAELQKKILKYTGIPTSIGIGPTKTLAKAANYLCKKELKDPIFNIGGQQHWLKNMSVADVWGIGRQWHKKLVQQGIYTAHDLAIINPHLLRKQYNVVMMRTAMELQGISCSGLVPAEPKQSILSSRSFGVMQTELAPLSQAVSAHCTHVYEKLRQQHSLAQSIYVFVKTNRFREDLAQYNRSAAIELVTPTDDLRLITHHAKKCLQKIYKSGFQYKKVGVCLEALVSKDHYQLDLFHQANKSLPKTEQVMTILDEINRKYGRNTMKLAAEGFSKSWAMKSELKSPAYTTQWSDLPLVKNDT
ncbi:Y-family DNA polymerase [Legionella maioricensis]|uniref:Y-family DNA polymerase n=1 Tax=Legionella maioricensis TaxID=2896528 RepID=A0A9X2D0H1_9GAMM|nr:Y-family DNA polymerase [Legionella maioricensis]MCL9683850.1 Y-family DNA polymerase [Legionella maioricensis]MCL9686697.1 Y-family DNA polymerase [Legionella maioricensis]